MRCCVCHNQVEEREVSLKFVGFDEDRTPLYQKLYAYYCNECESYRQVEQEYETGAYRFHRFRKAIKVRKSMLED